MLAQADHNNMDAFSKQRLKKKGGLDSAFPANLKFFAGGACPRAPLEFFGPYRTRSKGHFRLLRNLQQISHSLEYLRLERSATYGRLFQNPNVVAIATTDRDAWLFF